MLDEGVKKVSSNQFFSSEGKVEKIQFHSFIMRFGVVNLMPKSTLMCQIIMG